VIEIQYIKRESAPEPGESLLHNDWVSAIHSSDNLYVFIHYYYYFHLMASFPGQPG